jgi:hypothetical protein
MTYLFTKNDYFNLHKILGLLSLLMFIYRFFNFMNDMAFDEGYFTILTLILHLSLNLSSFIFKIPKKKNSTGYIIWDEYRIHALIFSSRSIIGLLYIWVKKKYQLNYNRLFSVSLVMLILSLSSLTSYYIGHNTTTIRGVTNNLIKKYNKKKDLLLSFKMIAVLSQLSMYSYCLTTNWNSYSILYGNLLVLQFTSFMMTLIKKGKISGFIASIIYTLILLFLFIIGIYNIFIYESIYTALKITIFTLIVYYFRCIHGVNKFLIWSFIILLTNII